MDFKYVRIQGREVADDTRYAAGIFSMCWKLIQEGVMDEEDVALYKEIDSWFAAELPFADIDFGDKHVVYFFKTSNTELMMRMITPAMWLLKRYNHPFYVVYTDNPGEILYEDDFQVAVEVPEVPVKTFHHQWTDPDGVTIHSCDEE